MNEEKLFRVLDWLIDHDFDLDHVDAETASEMPDELKEDFFTWLAEKETAQ